MIESTTIEILIQGGAVGVALVCLWIIYKLVTNHDSHLLKSLDRNTDAWVDNAKAIAELTTILKSKKKK